MVILVSDVSRPAAPFNDPQFILAAVTVPTMLSREGLEITDRQLNQLVGQLQGLVDYMDANAAKVFADDYDNVDQAYARLSSVI